MCTWAKLDSILNTLAVDVGFWSLTGYQHDDHFSKKSYNQSPVSHIYLEKLIIILFS